MIQYYSYTLLNKVIKNMEELRKKLFLMKDEKYKDFCSKLIPTINKEKFIGVRTSFLRSLAKEIYKTNEHKIVLNSLPHYYYEENTLHSCILSLFKDVDELLIELDKFFENNDYSELIEKQDQRLKLYSWKKTAIKITQILQSIWDIK